MSDPPPLRRPLVTGIGIVLAMFGTPLLLWGLRVDVGDPGSLEAYLGRELGVFALLGVLLLLVRKGEGLPLSSMGWRGADFGRSVVWGLIGLLPVLVALAMGIGLAQILHWKVGAQEAARYTPPLWATTITMLRAGITEEAFYRGYALERLGRLTGSPWIAVGLVVVPFALFHFRQGPAGILIAGVVAVVLSALYLRRRDLLAVMITHFIVDFVPNVVLPLLGAV